jgi:hypothetical protein
MKLHHNTVLTGGLVVPTSPANLLKPKGLIQPPRGFVGFPDLQKHAHGAGFQERLQQRARDAGAPIGGIYREVEDFDLVRNCACDEKPNDPAGDLRNRDIEPLRIPLRRLRRGALELRDRGSIFLARRPDGHSYFLGA